MTILIVGDELKQLQKMLDRLQKLTGARNDCQLAGLINVENSTVSRIRSGKFRPSVEFVQRAHKYGGMPADEILSYLPSPMIRERIKG